MSALSICIMFSMLNVEIAFKYPLKTEKQPFSDIPTRMFRHIGLYPRCFPRFEHALQS